MAVLIYLERNDESKLEKLTCTDIEQVWGTIAEETLSRFSPIPLFEYCHLKKKPNVYRRPIMDVTPTLEAEFRSLLMEAQPDSEVSVLVSCVRERPLILQDVPSIPYSTTVTSIIIDHALSNPHYILKRMAEVTEKLYNECTLEEKQYYDANIRVTQGEAIKMCVDTQGQDNDLWTLFRYGRFTGSRIYEVYTYTKNKKPNWKNKFKSIFKSNFVSTKAMEDGLMYEEDARQCLERKKNVAVGTAGILIHPCVPWVAYSPDGVVVVNDKPERLWENKTPQCGNNKNVDAAKIGEMYSCMSEGKLKRNISILVKFNLECLRRLLIHVILLSIVLVLMTCM